jgi:hypothetical protein
MLLLSSSCWRISLVATTAAETVKKTGAAGTETDATDTGREEEEKQDSNHNPDPPGGAALTIKTCDADILVTEGYVGSTLVVSHTLSTPDAVHQVVEVLLHLINCSLHIVVSTCFHQMTTSS